MSCRARWTTFLMAGVSLCAALVVVLASGTAPLAQEIKITEPGHYTENRGPNEAGVTPLYRIMVTATAVPSGLPTLVFAERGSARKALMHWAEQIAPNRYFYWALFEPGSTGPWRIVAERGQSKAMPVSTPALAKPQEVPLVRNVRVTGGGTTPRLTWELPNLTGFDVDRIRVAVRGGTHVKGLLIMGVLYVSGDLPATATAFTIPPGVLEPGERYILQVMLEDLEGEALENRSLTFSEPYTVLR